MSDTVLRKTIVLVFFLSLNVFAKDSNWQDVESKFSVEENLVNDSIISWKAVDSVQQTCELESRKRGLGGFKYEVEACSVWSGGVCMIITSKSPTTHILGHEVRHCFQGDFH